MQIGVVTVDGRPCGVVNFTIGEVADHFQPDFDGYVPEGRAVDSTLSSRSGGAERSPRSNHHHFVGHPHEHQAKRESTFLGGEGDQPSERKQPRGEIYSGAGGHPVTQSSAETDRAIVEAARAHNLDPNFMRAIADIESGMNPASNANRATQYKGLYQIGHDEWRRTGEGNIYSARDNAMAAGRLFSENRRQFRNRFGRDPTETEMYMMHQQGLGFYTRGAMTNIGGNPYPGMHGPQSHESFEAGWGRRLARGKAGYAARNQAATPVAPDIMSTAPMAAQLPRTPPKASGRLEEDMPRQQFYGPHGDIKRNPWGDMRKSQNIEDLRENDPSRDAITRKGIPPLDTSTPKFAVEDIEGYDKSHSSAMANALGLQDVSAKLVISNLNRMRTAQTDADYEKLSPLDELNAARKESGIGDSLGKK